MALNHREQIHQQLLEALYNARRHVEYLEAALRHNAAYLGTGVERESQMVPDPEASVAPDALIRYLELVEPEEDISDYIGSEGVDATRPRLGPDAPDSVRPKEKPPVNPLVRLLAQAHPDDSLAFPFKPGAVPPGTYLTDLEQEPSPADGQKTGEEAPPSAASGEKAPKGPAPASVSKPSGRPSKAPAPGEPVATSRPEREKTPVARPSLLVENVPTPHTPAPVQGRPQPPVAPVASGPHTAQKTVAVPTPLSTPPPGQELKEPEGKRLLFTASAPERPDKRFHSPGGSRPLTDEDCLRAHFALMALNEGVWDWNLRTGAVFISTRWEEIVGKAPSGLSSALATLTFGVHPDDAVALRTGVEELRKGIKNRLRMQVRIPRSQGKWGVGRLHALSQSTGKQVMRITAVLSDTADHAEKEADAAQAPATEKYAFFTNLDAGFALFTNSNGTAHGEKSGEKPEFTLLAVNPAFKNMYSLPDVAAGGMSLAEATGKDAEQWALCLGAVLSENKSVQYPLIRPGEATAFYEVSAFSPEPGKVACFVKNITETRKVEQEIRLNEARLAALYRLSHMDAASEDLVVRYCLKEAVRLTGSELGYLYVAAGPDGEHGRIYWSYEVMAHFGKEPAPPNFCASPWGEQKECLTLHGPEVVNAIGDVMAGAFGENIPVNRYILAPIMEEGRVVCIAAVANKKGNYEPSDLRQLELFINGMWFHMRRRWAVEHLRKAKEEAEAASRAKNEFLANVSHELRTPLNGILGMLQVLQQSPLDKEQMECVTMANYSGRSLLRIISDILDFSRIEAGRFELAPQLFDFAATVRSTLGMFIHEAERKEIRFSVYLSKNIPPMLVGDEARVRQIIFNLVGNAFKFTTKGEISVECEQLSYRRGGRRCIYLAVHDTGIGIPDDKLGDIFQAFTQIDGSSTRRYSGTGLGLAIVRRLTELMDGTITVESASGKGTSVYCTLAFDDPPVIEPLPESAMTVPGPVRPLDILVVEDDPVSQFTLRTLLKKAGHPSVCVSDGRQALEALLLHPFECIITDIQMPVMDGVELTLRIREGQTTDIEPGAEVRELLGVTDKKRMLRYAVSRDLPIIALTAHAMTGDKERFLGMGMDYYLSKPVTASELEGILAHISLLVQSRKSHGVA